MCHKRWRGGEHILLRVLPERGGVIFSLGDVSGHVEDGLGVRGEVLSRAILVCAEDYDMHIFIFGHRCH